MVFKMSYGAADKPVAPVKKPVEAKKPAAPRRAKSNLAAQAQALFEPAASRADAASDPHENVAGDSSSSSATPTGFQHPRT